MIKGRERERETKGERRDREIGRERVDREREAECLDGSRIASGEVKSDKDRETEGSIDCERARERRMQAGTERKALGEKRKKRKRWKDGKMPGRRVEGWREGGRERGRGRGRGGVGKREHTQRVTERNK